MAEKKVNYFTDYDNDSLIVSAQAERQGHRLLQNEFRRVSDHFVFLSTLHFFHGLPVFEVLDSNKTGLSIFSSFFQVLVM